MNAAEMDHYYIFGDVYETLDTCTELEQLLGRLRRQGMLSDQEWMVSKQNVAAIRSRLESRLTATS
jgi:hypothetical protein